MGDYFLVVTLHVGLLPGHSKNNEAYTLGKDANVILPTQRLKAETSYYLWLNIRMLFEFYLYFQTKTNEGKDSRYDYSTRVLFIICGILHGIYFVRK